MSSGPALPAPAPAPLTPTSPSCSLSVSTSLVDASTHSDPITRLDALLDIYLDRLDAYQVLRERLSNTFSHGFLALANANRTSNLGSGRRYGEEGYDERMKAARRLRISTVTDPSADEAPEKSAQSPRPPALEAMSDKIHFYTVQQHASTERPSEGLARTPPPETTTDTTQDSFARPSITLDANPSHSTSSLSLTKTAAKSCFARSPVSPTHHTEKSRARPKEPPDPLNWYGLLVPPSLRAAQTSFTTAVQGPIPQLLNVQAKMAELERQIRQARREAGLPRCSQEKEDQKENENMPKSPPIADEEQCEHVLSTASPSLSEDALKSDPQLLEQGRNIKRDNSSRSRSGSGRKSLSSRPTTTPREPPRSRVLKPDT